MVDADLERFATAITALAGAFRVEVSEPLIDGFWLGLQDLEWDNFSSAVSRSIATSEHFPRPAEIRSLAGGQTPEMRALLAWTAVRAAIKEHDAYRTVQFSDPAATAAVRYLGGWIALCNEHSWEELDKYVQPRFAKAYVAFSDAGVTPEMAAPLPGIWATHGSVDPASARVRLVAIAVAPARLLGVPAVGVRPKLGNGATGQLGGFGEVLAAVAGRVTAEEPT